MLHAAAPGHHVDRAAVERGLAERLVADGRAGLADIDRAARLAADRGEGLVAALSALGLAGDAALAAALAEETGLALAGPGDLPTERVEIEDLSPLFLRERRALPIAVRDEGVVVAMADPLDAYAREAIALAADAPVVACVGDPELIDAALNRLYGDALGDATDPFDDAAAPDAGDAEIERLRDMASEGPVIRMVDALIARAVERRASDIHLEPFEREFRVRYRVDGVLEPGETLPERLRAAVISRVKIMARLDIAERRLPQDGRIRTVVRGRAIDLRVSTLQIQHGESVVMRVLDRAAVALDLDRLGVGAQARPRLDEMLAAPHGVFLVTGPTGSGKTTTLYAALSQIAAPDRKVITVEDPIEYQIAGVNQVQVNPAIGLGFAEVLRSMLRQDPDVIMVGEIRDAETAAIATRAALTGHLVLATLHTNDAASAVTRLVDMGVEPFLLTPALLGVAGQRLVRSLCPECREPHAPQPGVIAGFGLERLAPSGRVSLYRPVGCEACGGRGYRGRTVVIEALRMTARLRDMAQTGADARALQAAAIEEGMTTMFEDGLRKALAGVTTLEEVLRATRDA